MTAPSTFGKGRRPADARVQIMRGITRAQQAGHRLKVVTGQTLHPLHFEPVLTVLIVAETVHRADENRALGAVIGHCRPDRHQQGTQAEANQVRLPIAMVHSVNLPSAGDGMCTVALMCFKWVMIVKVMITNIDHELHFDKCTTLQAPN